MLAYIRAHWPLWLNVKQLLIRTEKAEALATEALSMAKATQDEAMTSGTVSLAALNSIEVLAVMLVDSNGFLKTEMMAAQFRAAAVRASLHAKTYPEDALERKGLELMAGQISGVADNLLAGKEKKNDPSKN